MKKNTIKPPNEHYLSIEKILPHIWHIRFDSQYWTCATMMRISEFRESDIKSIQDSYFSIEEFMDNYAKETGQFSYFTDWAGFNIDDVDIRSFWKIYDINQLWEKEKTLWYLLGEIAHDEGKHKFSVIATYEDKDLIHEIIHALYYTKPKYKTEVLCELGHLSKKHPILYKRVKAYVKSMGYADDIIFTEMNAYLSDYTDRARILVDVDISASGYKKLSTNLIKILNKYYETNSKE